MKDWVLITAAGSAMAMITMPVLGIVAGLGTAVVFMAWLETA